MNAKLIAAPAQGLLQAKHAPESFSQVAYERLLPPAPEFAAVLPVQGKFSGGLAISTRSISCESSW